MLQTLVREIANCQITLAQSPESPERLRSLMMKSHSWGQLAVKNVNTLKILEV